MQLETVAAVLSVLVPTLSSIAYTSYRTGRRFGAIEEKLRQFDGRFEEVDGRFGELKGYVDGRLEELRKYVDGRFEEVDGRLEGLGERIDHRVGELGRAFSSYQEFLIEYLSVKGVVSDREALMLKNEAARVSRLAVVNPFTKEEWERLKTYLDRDVRDFTLEEAEDFRELGRKAIVEYPDKPEVYKLHMYATVVYGLTLRRVYEEKERKAA